MSFSVFYKTEAILMSTHNIHFYDKIRKFPCNTCISEYLFSSAKCMGIITCGFKNKFESDMVKEPSLFESLKFFCIGTP